MPNIMGPRGLSASLVPRQAAGLAVVVALAVGALGIWKGSFVAGDGDAFGYVSEANLIAHGTLRIEQQFVRTLPWPFADWSFAPAGYRPATVRGFIVPCAPQILHPACRSDRHEFHL
jgi:hypothetical protein